VANASDIARVIAQPSHSVHRPGITQHLKSAGLCEGRKGADAETDRQNLPSPIEDFGVSEFCGISYDLFLPPDPDRCREKETAA
jgi:hypothetical protein